MKKVTASDRLRVRTNSILLLPVFTSLLKHVINSLVPLVLIVIPLFQPNAPDGQKTTKMSYF